MEKGDNEAPTQNESTLVGETGLGFLKRDIGAKNEEDKGIIEFAVFKNDGETESLKALIDLKNIIAKQLPKMPKEYIVRLIFDRNHESLILLKKMKNPPNNKIIGGVVYRPFHEQGFAEVAFLAITSLEQVKGYGTRLMNKLKSHLQSRDIKYMLTYADNNAIGYFRKQGFTNSPRMPRKQWRGYIKDYEGGTLMEAYINPDIDFNNIYLDLKGQKQVVLEAVGDRYFTKKYELTEFKGKDLASDGEKEEIKPLYVDIANVKGIQESGWTVSEYEEAILMKGTQSFFKQCQSILRTLVNHSNSWPFRCPVEKAEVPDYYETIKDPIDLSVIGEQLECGFYRTRRRFKGDIGRMFNNARIYNKPSSIFYNYANELEKMIEPFLDILAEPGPIELEAINALGLQKRARLGITLPQLIGGEDDEDDDDEITGGVGVKATSIKERKANRRKDKKKRHKRK